AVAASASVSAVSRAIEARGQRGVARAWVGGVLLAYVALGFQYSARQQGIWVRGDLVSVGWARQEMDDWLRIGDLLRRVTLPTDTLATTAAGAIPYRSRLYTIDLLGLNAPNLSEYRRLDSERPGHTLLLEERWLDQNPPQILLGHPLV